MSDIDLSGQLNLELPSSKSALAIAGNEEETLRKLEDLTGVKIIMRGLQLEIIGRQKQIERAFSLIELIRPIWERGERISNVDIQAALNALDTNQKEKHEKLSQSFLAKSQAGKILRPRTLRQKIYIDAMENNDLTLAIGPAGTGKTFLATVLAVKMLTERKVERLILTRPAVEAGERLGFLPGDLQQKVDPYLRPLYDALHTLLGQERTQNLLEKGIIEVAPLAYMRGRTLEEAFIILDEAQNTTSAQMRMVLTRIGEKSRMVVTGDITQVDLPPGQLSGLIEASNLLKNVKGVKVCNLTSSDVIRHALVQRVIDAYAKKYNQ